MAKSASAFTLRSDRRYSPGEQRMFALLPKDGSTRSTTEIATHYYNKSIPLNGQKIVIGTLKSLRRKVAMNREPFQIMHSERNGPNPILFWIQKRG